jgi:hypothetical protein
MVASSSCTPSSNATASANHASGARSGIEPGQRFDADDRPRLELHDRLEHHRDAVALDESLDLVSPGFALLAFDLLPTQLGGELVNDAADDLGRQARPAVGHPHDGTHDVLGRGAFDEVADGASSQHLQHGGPVLERRQRDHASRGREALDLSRRAGSPSRGHLHVHERDVRLFTLGERDRLVGVRGRADEQDVLILSQQVCERATQTGFVVRDEDADALAHGCLDGGKTDGAHSA